MMFNVEGAAGGFVREVAFDDDIPMMVWLTEPAELDVERLRQFEVLSIDGAPTPFRCQRHKKGWALWSVYR